MVEEPEGLITNPREFKHKSVKDIAEGGKEAKRKAAEREEEAIKRKEAIETQAAGTRLGYIGAIKETRLSDNEEYKEFQYAERWCNSRLEIGTQLTRPDFWLDASHEERRVLEYRAELARAVNVKRTTGFTLENQANNSELAGFTKAETAALYRVPGVREAMETYIKYLDNADSDDERYNPIRNRDKGKEKPSHVSVLTIQDRDDAEQMRKQIAEREIAPLLEVKLRKKYPMSTKEEIVALRKDAARMAVDAEQIAFNLLYIGNAFESFDSKWSPERDRAGNLNDERRRLRKTSLMASELVFPGIKFIMNPMDALVVRSFREKKRLKLVGSFGNWAHEQIPRALERIGAENFDYVVVVRSDSADAEKKWWTAKKTGGGVTLYIPDCYPVQLMKSIWEETVITPREGQDVSVNQRGKASLIDFLRAEEEIPWEKPEAAGLWVDYTDSIRAVDTLWGYYSRRAKPDTSISVAMFGGPGGAAQNLKPWVAPINKALAEFQWADREDLKRWIIYAAAQVKEDERLPKLRMKGKDKDVLRIIGTDSPRSLRFIDDNNLFFPWDKASAMAKWL